MKLYGYVRISTPKQNIERQIRNILNKYSEAFIVKEIFTGLKFQGRKEMDKLLKILVPKDIIIFDSVSRMSRNADEGCELYEKLFNEDITLIFLKEPHINTEVYRQALENQISIKLQTGNNATDELMNTIIDALNKYTMNLAKEQIRIAFEQAEKEVIDLRQRTKEGMLTAKLNGKRIGNCKGSMLKVKKATPTKELIVKYSKDFNGSLSDKECLKIIRIARNTYYKYKKELKYDRIYI